MPNLIAVLLFHIKKWGGGQLLDYRIQDFNFFENLLADDCPSESF